MVLPKDLGEEIDRAKSAKALGWLRLLSQEVESRRFQWLALRAIGRAQWDINDPDGARATYKKPIAHDPDDLDVKRTTRSQTSTSVNIEREKLPQLLTLSDQAIDRVLANNRSTLDQRTEALSLKGRNAKTRWRQTFENLNDPAQRLRAAVNRQLLQAYDGYMKAFSDNLNQPLVGTRSPADVRDCEPSCLTRRLGGRAFDNKRDARDRKDDLTRVSRRSGKRAAKMAVQQARGPTSRLEATTAHAGPMAISNADWLFLTEPKDGRVRRAYTDSVPSPPWFLDAS